MNYLIPVKKYINKRGKQGKNKNISFINEWSLRDTLGYMYFGDIWFEWNKRTQDYMVDKWHTGFSA